MSIPRSSRLLFGVLALVSTVVGCSASAQSHLDRGNEYLEKKNVAAAILEFRNAVRKDPTLAAAYLKLADAFLRQGDGGNAIGAYVRAADLLPKDADVQLKAGSLLLMAGKPQDAMARADKAIAINAQNVDALVLRANAMAGLTDLDGAVKQIQEAIAMDPTAARQTNLGVLELAKGRSEESEAAFRQALATDPKSVQAQLGLANLFWATGRAAEAETALKAALALDPNNVAANRALATFYLVASRASEAETYVRRLADTDPDPAARFALADYFVGLKRHADALGVLDELSTSPQTWARARSRVATLQYADGNKAQAYDAIDEVIAKQANDASPRLIRGRFLLTEGKTDEALAEAQEAVKSDSRNAEAQFLLGSAQRTKRNLEEAQTAFQEVLQLNPRASAAQVQLALIELERGSVASATQLVDEVARREPDNIQARRILARSLMESGDLNRATTVTRELLAEAPNVGSVHAQAGLLALRKNDQAGARASFERALALDPTLVEALIALATLDVAQGQGGRARMRFEERLQKAPNNSSVLLGAARTWGATGDNAKAEEFLRRAIEADATNFDAYALLGQLYVFQKRLDEALTEYDRLAARRPGDLGASTMGGLILQAQGKEDEARQRYERLVEVAPRAAVASNNLAWIYARRGDQLDRALRLAQAAKAEMPDHPQVNDTLAFVYLKRQLPTLAIPLLRLAVEKDPRNPSIHYHLGLAYSQTGDKGAARQAMEQALQLKDDFEDAEDARRILRTLG